MDITFFSTVYIRHLKKAAHFLKWKVGRLLEKGGGTLGLNAEWKTLYYQMKFISTDRPEHTF